MAERADGEPAVWSLWVAAALAGRVSGFAMPTAAADSDNGLGVGGRGAVAWRDDGYAPYRLAAFAAAYVSVKGYQSHSLRVDAVGLGIRNRWRITASLAYRAWLHDGYYGVGGGTLREAALVGPFDEGDLRRQRYAYGLRQPSGQLTVRYTFEPGEPWEMYLALNQKYSVIEAYEGSLLEEERPYGLAGGGLAQLVGGLIHDTRSPEINSRRGHLLELGWRSAPAIDAEAGGFYGALLSARWFAPLGGRAVLAQRVMGEALGGQIPFYEMVTWGGMEPIVGFGGGQTLRGVPLGRWRGPLKAVAQTELRWTVMEHELMGAPFAWMLVPWVDVGVVGGAALGGEGFPAHPGAGGSLRVVYDGTFVGRVDTGLGLDPVQEKGGSITRAANWGFYVFADHPF